MSQSTVTVRLNGQPYQMGCDAGQEAHIEALGRDVEAVLNQLTSTVGQIGEARLLAMAALIIADRKSETPAHEHDAAATTATASLSAEELDQLAGRIKVMAGHVSQLTAHLAKLP
tara:strand:+ start:262 stop:606 length:345 start_codon:yes stop_codon:yes gene_type:complete